MLQLHGFTGELAALSAAFLWAAATVLFGRIGRVVRPVEMNLIKNILASALVFFTLLFTGNLPSLANATAVWVLMLSGGVGIGLGDTAYFSSLKCIGARRALLLGILSPPMTGVLAYLFMGEIPGFGACLGIGLTVSGVAWVIVERTAVSEGQAGLLPRGIAWGIISALAQATGAVLSRAVMVQEVISPLESSFWRLLGGVLAIFAWLLLARQKVGRWMRGDKSLRLWGLMAAAVFMGTYLGIWLQQVSLKLTAAGIAQTLFFTSPLFVIPIVVCMGEKVSARAILGAVIALSGVGLLLGM